MTSEFVIMIDITDDLIRWAKEIEEFEGRVYRIYPQKNLAGKTYCIVTPTAHAPRLMEDGQEVIADLGWTVQVIGKSPTTLDNLMEQLIHKYGGRNVLCEGITQGYNPDYRMYNTMATFTATVDKRRMSFI